MVKSGQFDHPEGLNGVRLAAGFDVTQDFFWRKVTDFCVTWGYTKFIMPAGIMSSAGIKSAGLIGYPMIHPVKPVTQTDQSESGQISDGSPDIRIDRIRSISLA